MRFVVLAWVLTRVLILAILLSAGHAASLATWDGAWYGSIVEHGYEFVADGKQHNAAFFPLLPVLAWPLVHAGAAWPVAAALLANIAFLGALIVLYRIARSRYDETAACWCVATASLLPPSLFCSVAYPQSLFLFFSALALLTFSQGRYAAGGLAAALSSAASALGIPLAAAMLVDALFRRRVATVVWASIGFAGVVAFAIYCWIRLGDALAFVHAQHAWRHGFGFDAAAWKGIVQSLLTLDGFRQNAAMLLVPLGLVAVLVESRKLGRVMTLYALFTLALLILSGTPFSVDRNAYAIAPLLVALGALLRRVPPVGYVVLAISAILLVVDAGRFAHFQWVA